jgi:hypothetical protein
MRDRLSEASQLTFRVGALRISQSSSLTRLRNVSPSEPACRIAFLELTANNNIAIRINVMNLKN